MSPVCEVSDFWQAMATAGMMIALNSPMHIITSYYTGVMLVETHIHKKNFQWYHYVAKPVLMRGFYQFSMFAMFAFGLSTGMLVAARCAVAVFSILTAGLWLRGQKRTVLMEGGFQRIDPLEMEEKWESV